MVQNEGGENIPSEILVLLEDATFEIALLAETVKNLTAASSYLCETLESYPSEEAMH